MIFYNYTPFDIDFTVEDITYTLESLYFLVIRSDATEALIPNNFSNPTSEISVSITNKNIFIPDNSYDENMLITYSDGGIYYVPTDLQYNILTSQYQGEDIGTLDDFAIIPPYSKMGQIYVTTKKVNLLEYSSNSTPNWIILIIILLLVITLMLIIFLVIKTFKTT